MGKARRTLSYPQEVSLLNQAQSVCPLCGTYLFYDKNGQRQKGYELAHIYPLNPTSTEADLLSDEELSSEDPNHSDNILPLCPSCHSKFDKPRTVAEYRRLFELKEEMLLQERKHRLQSQYVVETDINQVIGALNKENAYPAEAALNYDPQSLEQKFDDSLPPLTQRKIRRDVAEYFPFVEERMREVDQNNPGSASLIGSQVRTYYLAQMKEASCNQSHVIEGLVDWLSRRTGSSTREAPEIVVAYFVQSCEVLG